LELVNTILVLFPMSTGVGFSSIILAISIPVWPKITDPARIVIVSCFIVLPLCSYKAETQSKSLHLIMNQNKFIDYHRIAAEAQVYPAPNAARIIKSPLQIFPSANASHMAIGMEAAVVFPYL